MVTDSEKRATNGGVVLDGKEEGAKVGNICLMKGWLVG